MRLIGLVPAIFSILSAIAAEFPKIYNTEQETIPFLKADETLAGITLPDGFKATVFASEPQVLQPIQITTDARGRIWVSENFTYAERAKNFDNNLRDRIVILEDTDNDGRADKRTVFWDEAVHLTAVLPAFGGVFALCPPQLLFIPDADRNDVPDSAPVVLLDGFDASAVRHNIANGLKIGPDGWIYGRHGILASSYVGLPGTPKEQRTLVNVSIWRYHPTAKKFEVVANGTTNPWGNDWDQHGQHFFINTVIGHLWHVIPGAYYKKMYGEHPNPYLYELIDQTADHFHWDTKETWSDVRKIGVTSTSSERGGGHAHSGFLIYNGDNWPEQFRNTALTVNYHGRRLNNDRLERAGASYVAKHNADLMFVKDEWFRGVELASGPDGAVYVADWSDIGECHDDSGIHRTSGRIFKIFHGNTRPWTGDLNKATDEELLRHLLHKNEWFARASRQILQERAASGQDFRRAHAELRRMFQANADPVARLRILWTIYVTGDLDEQMAHELLGNENEHIRSWAIQLLTDFAGPNATTASKFASLAKSDPSGLVLTFLASALRKATPEQRFDIASGLVTRKEFAEDRVLPLMVWYGIEPHVPTRVDNAIALAAHSDFPRVHRFIARRLFEDYAVNPIPGNLVIGLLSKPRSAQYALEIMAGIDDALKGVQKAKKPDGWDAAAAVLSDYSDSRVGDSVRQISALFGEGRALDHLRGVVADPKAELGVRRRAFATLLQSQAPNLLPLIEGMLVEMDISQDAIRALAALGEPATPQLLIPRFNDLRSGGAKKEAINALASRSSFAGPLLEAVKRGAIKRADIDAAQLRQLRSLNDPKIKDQINAVWPQLDASQQESYAKYKALLTPESISKADASAGRALFTQTCAACHLLYGQGTAIGPDLTGSDRRNLDYLLDNLLHPSAIVPETYRVSTINMKDDRVISGIILNQTDRTVNIQTTTEKLTLQKSEVQNIQTSQLSMMPDGLLDPLAEKQIQDLFAYLMSQAPPSPGEK